MAKCFIAQSQPGFESIVSSEIAARVRHSRELGRRLIRGRAGMVIFTAPNAGEFSGIRTVEDLFALVGSGLAIGPGQSGLDRIRAIARTALGIEEALRARLMLRPGSRAGRRLDFRVIARKAGEHQFRRVDVQRAVERGISERSDRSWRISDGPAKAEFWVTLIDDEVMLALRLTDGEMRHREYKAAHRTASLRSAVGAALAWLSDPQPDDIVLDPLCGVGTVLIERAHLGRYAMLLGGDADPDALAGARENIGPRYKPIELRLWDAVALPLPTASVSKVITNLPWGRKVGSHSGNRELYPRLLAELKRVTKPGGTIVLLTAETGLMRSLAERGFFRPRRILHVTVLGRAAAIYVYEP